MKLLQTYILCLGVIALSILPAFSQEARQNVETSNLLPPIKLNNVKVSQLVEVIGKKWKINLISDVIFADITVQKVDIAEVRPSQILQVLQNIFRGYGRVVDYTNGVYVAQHSLGYFQHNYRTSMMKTYNIKWPDTSKVSLIEIDTTRKDSRLDNRIQLMKVQAETKAKPKPKLNVRKFHGAVHEANVKTLLSEFTKLTNWSLTISPSRNDFRITAHLEEITPGQFLDAICLYLNVRPNIAFDKTPDMATLDNPLDTEIPVIAVLSDDLAQDILKFLSPEQREKIANRQDVKVALSSMPPDVRKKAEKYIKAASNRAGDALSSIGIPLDSLRNFSINFLGGNNLLTVSGYREDGTGVHF